MRQLVLCAVLMFAGACKPKPATLDTGGAPVPASMGDATPCDEGGSAYFRGALTGEYALDLAWLALDGGLACGSVSHPDGLDIAMGGDAGDRRFDITFTLLGLDPLQVGEVPADVTIGTEGGLWAGDGCLIELAHHALLDRTRVGDLYELHGSGSCPPVMDVLGNDDLQIDPFEFQTIGIYLPF